MHQRHLSLVAAKAKSIAVDRQNREIKLNDTRDEPDGRGGRGGRGRGRGISSRKI